MDLGVSGRQFLAILLMISLLLYSFLAPSSKHSYRASWLMISFMSCAWWWVVRCWLFVICLCSMHFFEYISWIVVIRECGHLHFGLSNASETCGYGSACLKWAAVLFRIRFSLNWWLSVVFKVSFSACGITDCRSGSGESMWVRNDVHIGL
jgi:hypothetical protein